MICTTCGSACPEGAKYCMECGAPLPVLQSPIPEEPVIQPAPAEDIPMTDAPEQTSPEAPEVSEPEPMPENAPLPQEELSAQEPISPSPEPEPFPIYQTSPYQVPAQAAAQVPPAPPKQGNHWIPIAIMAVLCVLGLTLFLALPFDTPNTPTISDSETPWFHNDNGTLYFYEEYYNGPEELTVPELVDGQPVTALAPYCFAGCDFTTVILPDTLERIGANAFDSCANLRGIFLPEGVTYIGAEAFYCCFALEAICIPSTVKAIESDAFSGCLKLQYILYNGIHSHWLDLYEDMIGAGTQVYCTDGTFIQHQNNR